METLTVSLQVGDLAGQQFVDVEALVDIGSNYTVLTKEEPVELGIEQECQRSLELGDIAISNSGGVWGPKAVILVPALLNRGGQLRVPNEI